MRVSVTENRTIYIEQNYNTQNENEATIIQLQVPEKYQDYNKKIVFITDEGMVWDLFQNNEYVLTSAITKFQKVQFYIWLTKGDKDFRSQTRELVFTQNDGEPSVTPEEVDGVRTVVALLDEEIEKVEDLELDIAQALSQVNTAIEQTNNLNLDANKQGKTTTVNLTKKDGTTKTVQIDDGVSLQFMWQGTQLGIKTENQQEYTFVDLQGIQGPVGPQGEAFRIKKTYASVAEMNADFNNMQIGDYVMIASSVELEDNAKLYTRGENSWIFISDFSGAMGIKGETGATPNIQIGTVVSGNAPSVTRTGTAENPILNFILEKGDKGDTGATGATGATGNGIANIQKTGTSGLVDTYTITYTNGTTSTIVVNNGKGISNIAKTGTSGLVDTYTITYNDGTTSTYTVTNGEDGEVTQAQLDEVIAENEYLNSVIEQAFDEISGQGENVTLENTIEARFKKAPLPKSNSYQATRSGKNILATPSGTKQLNNQYYYSDDLGITITQDMVNKAISFSFKITISSISTEATTVYAGLGYGDSGYTAELKSTNYSDYSVGDHIIKIENAIITSEMVGKKIFARHLGFNQASTATYTWTNAQFEFSATATDYEPYGVMPSPEFPSTIQNVTGDVNITVANRNLLQLINSTIVNPNGITAVINNGEITLNGTATANNFINIPINLPVENVEYVWSANNTVANDNIVLSFDDGTTNYMGQSLTNVNQTKSYIFDNPIILTYFTIRIANGQTLTNYKIKPQFEKGSTATEYVLNQLQPYTIGLGAIELCKIGNYQDYIYKSDNDNKWYKHQELGKVVFDGTENWVLAGEEIKTDRYAVQVSSYNLQRQTLGLCNNNIYVQSGISQDIQQCAIIDAFYYRINKSILNEYSVAKFKEWVSNNNIIIQVPLITPRDIEITDTTLISQLEAIEKATSYKGTTHIYSTNELSPIFDVVALGKE